MKNMRKTFAFLAAFVSLSTFDPAEAVLQEGFYVGGLGGANFIHERSHSHYNVGYAAGATAGYGWTNGFRTEAEATYRHNAHHEHRNSRALTHRHSHLKSWSGMANLIYDMQLCWSPCTPCWMWRFYPYAGAGIGYTHQRQGEHARTGFAWQVIGGLSYELTPCVDLALDYRFHKGSFHHIYENTLNAAIRFYF